MHSVLYSTCMQSVICNFGHISRSDHDNLEPGQSNSEGGLKETRSDLRTNQETERKETDHWQDEMGHDPQQ